MVLNCVVTGCNNLHDPRKSVSFHTFPFKRPDILELWISAIQRNDWYPSKTSRICGHHFLESDYKIRPGSSTKQLKSDAVPSIFLVKKVDIIKDPPPDDKADMVNVPTWLKREIKEENDWEYNLDEDLPSDFKDEPYFVDITQIKQEPGFQSFERPLDIKLELEDTFPNVLVKSEFEVNNPDNVKTKRLKRNSNRSRKVSARAINKFCNICNQEYKDAKTYRRHMLIHTGERPFQCGICGSTFREKYNLGVHIKSHTGERNIPCPLCDKNFIVQSALKAHMRTHSQEKPYICNICGKGFSHRANLKPHMTTHSEEFPFACEECGRSFRNRKGLVRHQRRHHNDCQKEGCVVCAKYTKKTKEGTKPKTKWSGQVKPRECPLCYRIFKYPTTFKNHMRMHNNENFQCEFCDKTYLNKAALKIHLRNHTGETPFECNVCWKKFKRRDSYKYHMSTHDEARALYNCDICNQGFTHKSSVFKHKRHVHDTEKPFECEFCNRRFLTEEFLESHLKMHMDDKLKDDAFFSCRICGKSLETRVYNKHMRLHGIKMFKCRKCKNNIEGKKLYEIHKESKCTILTNGQNSEDGVSETAVNFNAESNTGDETANNDEINYLLNVTTAMGDEADETNEIKYPVGTTTIDNCRMQENECTIGTSDLNSDNKVNTEVDSIRKLSAEFVDSYNEYDANNRDEKVLLGKKKIIAPNEETSGQN